ncbi:MAG TPA: lantibiotic dehydratase [Kofleriaceae bacterium]|nr:lantibiotic dehydratase [Kofleriaceae bacterium]
MASRAHDIRAGDGIVVRTPLLPVDVLLDWPIGADIDEQRRYLADLVARPDVSEAIFVASPGLHGAIDRWRAAPDSEAGQRAEHALVKYAARMSWRTTPFGLFSGVSAGRLGSATAFDLAPRAEYRRQTRLDNDYLFLLAGELARAPEVRAGLRWRPSTSIYRLGGRLRYAQARLVGKERSYHLVSVEPTPYLDATLARAASGARPDALAGALVADDPDVTPDDAAAYVAELMDEQILVPELGIHVTGPEPIDGMLDQLSAVEPAAESAIAAGSVALAGSAAPAEPAVATAAGAGAALARARDAIAALDAAGVGNDPARYRDIARDLEALPAAVDPALLFQVDLVKPAAATLGARVASEVARTIAALSALWPRPDRSSLDEWRRAFDERWEGREVPLAEALDEESGLGFESATGPGAEGAPLLAGIAFPPPAQAGGPRGSWTAAEAHLLRRLSAALQGGADEIELGDDDLAAMTTQRAPVLPDAFSAMIRVGASPDGQPVILFEGSQGPSGARLLGRFCHASREVRDMVDAHHRAEEALRPGAVFAEVVHLNEGRIGNILCRPVLRGHEIVFLGVSGAPADGQIAIDDLMVSVRGTRIVLRSRRLGREVIPRLSTAHNYRLRSLAVYRFLCSLAAQGCDHAGFTWGSLDGASFLPRVRLGRVVLARATWNLGEGDIEPVTGAVRAAGAPAATRARVLAAVADLRAARRLPRFAALVAGDNELPVDLDNPLLAAAFADELAGQKGARVCEMFPAPDRLIARADDGRYTSEVILTFTRAAAGSPPEPPAARAPAIRRSFPPGSEWLYAKIYCGASTADRVLREAVGPVARRALAAGDASHWFFIRYADPGNHVRVRFAGRPARLMGEILPALDQALAPLVDSAAVQRVQLDTYARETERYGGDAGIQLVERLFWIDSEAVLDIVDLLDGDAGGDARWRLALRGIDGLLEALGLDPAARAALALRARDSLGAEHGATPQLWSALGERFTRERADLEVVFARDPARDSGHPLEPGFAILAERDRRLAEVARELGELDRAGALSPGPGEMAWSLAHMHANRLLHASQRAQEMVLYDFLRRLHAARRARGAAAGERARAPASGGGR